MLDISLAIAASGRPPRVERILPVAWLGQSADTSCICSTHHELNRTPFLTSLGCAIRKPSLIKTHFNSDLRAKLGVRGPLMVDSGGFALVANPRARWMLRDVEKIIRAVEADIFVSLDFPPTTRDTSSERRTKIIRSVESFYALSSRIDNKIIMPVVHGRRISEIELSVKLLAREGRNFAWIGLGGIVPLLKSRRVSREISSMGPEVFIARALRIIRQANPRSRIHAFGAGGTRTFPALFAFGADSADSIGWRQAAGFGSIFLPLKSQRVVKWNSKGRAPRRQLDDADIAQLEVCVCPVCAPANSASMRILQLQKDFYNRSIHNAWVTANQFRYWPDTRRKMQAFISSGGLGARWMTAIEQA